MNSIKCMIVFQFAFFCLISADQLSKILIKFTDEDCIPGDITQNDGKLQLQTLTQSILKDDVQIVLNTAQKEGESLLKKPDLKDHPVSYVNRLASFNKLDYAFDVINKEGPSHKPTFHMKLTLGDEEYTGVGKNKKDAKKMAAIAAIENTHYLPPKSKSKKSDSSTPTAALNNISQKLGIQIEYFAQGKNELRLEKDAHYSIEVDDSYLQQLNKSIFHENDGISIEDNSNSQGPFKVIVSVGNQKFIGFGHSKQSARHDAAANALRSLKEQFENSDDICTHLQCDKDLIKSPVSLIHEVATKLGVILEFDVTSEAGLDHKKQFTIQCKFDVYTSQGEGSSKKEAKKNAAYSMLHLLQRLKDIKPATAINNILEKQKVKRRTMMDNVQRLVVNAKESFASMVQSLYNTIEGSFNNYDEKNKESKSQKEDHNTNFKDNLLRIGIVTKFSSYKSQDTQYSFVSLNTRPSYICLGQGPSQKIAENSAAFHTLKFIKKNNILPAENTKEDVTTQMKDDFKYELFILNLETSDK